MELKKVPKLIRIHEDLKEKIVKILFKNVLKINPNSMNEKLKTRGGPESARRIPSVGLILTGFLRFFGFFSEMNMESSNLHRCGGVSEIKPYVLDESELS